MLLLQDPNLTYWLSMLCARILLECWVEGVGAMWKANDAHVALFEESLPLSCQMLEYLYLRSFDRLFMDVYGSGQ